MLDAQVITSSQASPSAAYSVDLYLVLVSLPLAFYLLLCYPFYVISTLSLLQGTKQSTQADTVLDAKDSSRSSAQLSLLADANEDNKAGTSPSIESTVLLQVQEHAKARSIRQVLYEEMDSWTQAFYALPDIPDSVWQGLDRLRKTCGCAGLYRALPASLVYFYVYQSVYLVLGKRSPLLQMYQEATCLRRHREGLTSCPLATLASIVVRLFLIPLDVAITRQSVGKPDGTTAVSLLKFLLRHFTAADFRPILLPSLLCIVLSTILEHGLALMWVSPHFDMIKHGVVRDALGHLLFSFTVVPMAYLQAIVYRSHFCIIARMPQFEQLVKFPASYAGMKNELFVMIEEDRCEPSPRSRRFHIRHCVMMWLSTLMSVAMMMILLLVSLYNQGIGYVTTEFSAYLRS
jgi:hypothetical protein